MATKDKGQKPDIQKIKNAAPQQAQGVQLRTDASQSKATLEKVYTGEEIIELYEGGRRDFSGINASGVCFFEFYEHINVWAFKTDLKGINLKKANLEKANLKELDLSGADLEGACTARIYAAKVPSAAFV